MAAMPVDVERFPEHPFVLGHIAKRYRLRDYEQVMEIVMRYIDCVSIDEKQAGCWRECRRAL